MPALARGVLNSKSGKARAKVADQIVYSLFDSSVELARQT